MQGACHMGVRRVMAEVEVDVGVEVEEEMKVEVGDQTTDGVRNV